MSITMPSNGDSSHFQTPFDSTTLLHLDLFKVSTDDATRDEKIALAYHRARAIARAYGTLPYLCSGAD